MKTIFTAPKTRTRIDVADDDALFIITKGDQTLLHLYAFQARDVFFELVRHFPEKRGPLPLLRQIRDRLGPQFARQPMPALTIEYHYTSGDVGVHPVTRNDLSSTLEELWNSFDPNPTDTPDRLVFRRATADEIDD